MRSSIALAFALVGCASAVRAPADAPLPLPSVVATAAPPPPTSAPGEHTSREWLALAEEAFAHDRMIDAARFYEAALRADDEVAPYAWYKLGFLRWNQNDGAAAMLALVHAIRSAEEHHDEKIASAARKDIVPIYAQYGAPSRAYDFFRTLGPSPLVAVESLGEQYLDQGEWSAAHTVFADLSARDATHACAHRVREKAADDASRGAPVPTRAEIAAAVARCP